MKSTIERRGLLAGLVALVLLGLGWVFFAGGPPDEDPSRERVAGSENPTSSFESAGDLPSAVSARGLGSAAARGGEREADDSFRVPLPRSLHGTDVDGGLTVGQDGHFVPDPDALALFNYYFSATGEEPDPLIAQRIRDHIVRELDPPAEGEAIELLETVLGFRTALRGLAESQWVPEDMDRRLQWLRELRRDHFGAATAESLFGAEEEKLLVELERRRVARDDSLSPAEREAELDALEMERPEAEREARRKARAPTRLGQRAAALRQQGASEDEIFALRAEEVGPEAATRLAALDAQRAAWQTRLEAFRGDLQALGDRASGARAASEGDAVDDLLRHHFEDHEILRVRAIEGL